MHVDADATKSTEGSEAKKARIAEPVQEMTDEEAQTHCLEQAFLDKLLALPDDTHCVLKNSKAVILQGRIFIIQDTAKKTLPKGLLAMFTGIGTINTTNHDAPFATPWSPSMKTSYLTTPHNTYLPIL